MGYKLAIIGNNKQVNVLQTIYPLKIKDWKFFYLLIYLRGGYKSNREIQ
jgi:hypothetical protein